jgi:hypothetical protein
VLTADQSVPRLALVAAALEAVARATTSADAEALAACEPSLEAALAQMPKPADMEMVRSTAVDEQLQRIQHALTRCRTIGRATTDLVTASLSAQGVAHSYLPTGVGVPPPRLGRLEVRV